MPIHAHQWQSLIAPLQLQNEAAAAAACRLIDELRSTVRCKAGAVYVDADPRFSPTFMSYGMR
jgi:hypothetical protein